MCVLLEGCYFKATAWMIETENKYFKRYAEKTATSVGLSYPDSDELFNSSLCVWWGGAMRLQGYITLQCSSCSCENAYISASLSVFQEVSQFQFHSKSFMERPLL